MSFEALNNQVLWRGVFILDPTTGQPNSQTYPVWVQMKPGTSVGSGQETVVAAGTAVPLSTTSTSILSVTVKALATNTGDIYVGGSTVAAANGYVLAAGELVSLDVDDLMDVYIDAAVNGEGVSFIYVVP